MFYRLKRLLAYPANLLWARLAPVGYARSIGVNVKGALTIYGSSYDMFSSEPFLVTLGDNVFISLGAKFICHDGGVLPFRKWHPTFDLAAPITVGDNCFIGMGAVILKGGDDRQRLHCRSLRGRHQGRARRPHRRGQSRPHRQADGRLYRGRIAAFARNWSSSRRCQGT